MLCRSLLLLLVFLCSNTPGFAQNWLHSLQTEYRNKVFLIRGFYKGDSLHFAADGSLKKPAHSGSWTTAGLQVRRIKLEGHHLEVSGTRVIEISGPSGLHPVRSEFKVNIEMDEPVADEQAVRKSLSLLFVDPNEPLAQLLPKYWRFALEHKSNSAWPSQPTDKQKKEGCLQPTLENPCLVGEKDVTPPKPLSTPDPTYAEMAQRSRYQGTSTLAMVVDDTGTPQRIRIIRPLGFGLDDRAVEAVRGWKFSPGRQNGRPVPVQIDVEIAFRLR